MTSVQADVVVVGAGPTGLMLANCLLRLDIGVTVLDAKAGPTRESRAVGVQARTMEIYDQLGIIDQVLAEAEVAEAIAPGFERRIFGRLEFGALGRGTTPYPHVYELEQSKNEQLLYDNLLRLGGKVRWGHRVTSASTVPNGGGAMITADGPGKPARFGARYCVGADGTSSAIRNLCGIGFEGKTNPQSFYVADAVGVRGLIPDAVNIRLASEGFLITFPMGDGERHRLIGTITDTEAKPGEAEAGAREQLARVYGISYGSLRWFSTYRVHHRVATRFRDGPFFLAGDAAHVHSPVGAQGMNTGLQDAHNLACKLADVAQGRATDAYLDRYQAERRRVAQRLISTTDRLFGAITSTSLLARSVRRLATPVGGPLIFGALPRIRAGSRFFEYVSQTRVHYWMSEQAQTTGKRDRVVGRRLRWTGGNFDVLRSLTWQVHVYGGVEQAVLDQVRHGLGIEVHEFVASPAAGLLPGTLYLVRPDGFVAAKAAAGDGALSSLEQALPSR